MKFRKRDQKTKAFARRSRTAVVLFIVVVYGMLAGAFHHHSIRPSRDVSRTASILSSESGTPAGAPLSNESSNCATCNLQRTFNQALTWPSINVDGSYTPSLFVAHSREHKPVSARTAFSPRAPPLA